MSTEGSVNYTVKELLAMLEKTLTEQINKIGVSVEEVNRKLDLRASTASVEALEGRVGKLEQAIIDIRVSTGASAAFSRGQLVVYAVVAAGIFALIGTLIYLASGGTHA